MKQSQFFSSFFLLGAAIQLLLFWPGQLVPDSHTQYNHALAGIYSDHHPALMSFLWHYLHKIYPGPGLMLTVNILLLHGAAYVFYRAFENDKKAWTFILLPWIPGVIAYLIIIVKDLPFAYGFLLCAALLTKGHMHQRKLSLPERILFFAVLFYATGVKFQGQYLAPILIFWYIGHQFFHLKLFKKTIVLIASLGLFYTSLHEVNNYLVPSKQKDHAWQLVKLFDLAVISIKNDTDYIPSANQGANYSYINMKTTFENENYYAIDCLYYANQILIRGKSKGDRDILWYTWAKAVLEHPIDYLAHRMRNMETTVFFIPGFERVERVLKKHLGDEGSAYETAHTVSKFLTQILVAGFLSLVLGLYYLSLGIRSWNKSRPAKPLVYILIAAFGMPSLLLFFSMAGTARYIIITMTLIHATHLMAWRCYRDLNPKGLKA